MKGGARVCRELQSLHNLANILQVQLETLSILKLFSSNNIFLVIRKCWSFFPCHLESLSTEDGVPLHTISVVKSPSSSSPLACGSVELQMYH